MSRLKQRKFKKLINQYKDLIFNQAYYVLGNHADACDISQEVMLKFWQNMDDVNRKAVKVWLIKTTKNACIDLIRRNKEWASPSDRFEEGGGGLGPLKTDESANPERLTITQDLKKHLHRAIGLLPPKLRTAIVLREIQDLKYEEIAQAMEEPVNTVKSHIHRGRKMLFEMLQYERRGR